MQLLLNSIAETIDRLSEWFGRVVSWVVILLVLVIVYDVVMRYLFQIGSVALQELEWHLFALIFLLGASYTLKEDGHVRVDIFYQSEWMTDRRRAWIDLSGSLFFLLPFSLIIIVSSWSFVERSFLIAEGSPDPGGLPYRFMLKAAIPLAFTLLIIQGVAVVIRSISIIRGATDINDKSAATVAIDNNKNKDT